MMTFEELLIKNGSTFEMEVYKLLLKCTEQEESISQKIDHLTHAQFDFYLPQGLKKLEWSKDTFVEVKYRMSPQSLNIIRRGYDIFQCKQLVVIVYDENTLSQFSAYPSLIGMRNIVFLSFKQFKDDVEKVCSAGKIVNTNTEILSPLRKLSECFNRKERLSLFIGAGVSSSAGVPTWDRLLEELCVRKGIDKIDSDIDSVVKGRFIVEKYRDNQTRMPDAFYKDIYSILYNNTRDSQLMNSIAHIVQKSNVVSIITYNYDNLFEYCLQKICSQNNLFESLYDEAKATSQYKIHVNHPHGYLNITDMKDNSGKIIKDSRKCILTESSYYEIERYQYCWENQVVANALNDGTCVFFGFSGTDYNFKRILNNIKSESDGKDSNHFIIVAIDDTVNSLDDFDEKCDRKLPGEGISMESKVLLHRSLAMKELYWRKKNILPIWTTIEELPALIERISH